MVNHVTQVAHYEKKFQDVMTDYKRPRLVVGPIKAIISYNRLKSSLNIHALVGFPLKECFLFVKRLRFEAQFLMAAQLFLL